MRPWDLAISVSTSTCVFAGIGGLRFAHPWLVVLGSMAAATAATLWVKRPGG